MPPCRPALAASLSWARNRSAGSPSSGTLLKTLTTSSFKPEIHAVHAQAVEIVGHAADARADRHLVVVENHEQPATEWPGIVHRFVNDAGGKRAVADDRHAPALVVRPGQLVAARQPDCRRNARAGVARHEEVVFALLGIGVAHQAALGPHRMELRIATGEQLVRIDLVAGIPDQPVVEEIKRLMQREAELDDTQVRREMGAAARDQIAKDLAHFARQPFELGQRKVVQIAAANGSSGGWDSWTWRRC